MSVLDNIAYVPCHSGNHGTLRIASDIRYLVYHYTGNDGDTGARNAQYYAENVVKASAHYFVDDGGVTRSVPDLCVAWAVGGSKWRDCGETGGGTLHGVVTNRNSLSIELCDTVRDGELMATEATLEHGAALGRALMEKYNIPIENVVRHFDVTGKHCPAYFMDEARWAAFKQRLVGKNATLTCAVTLPVLRLGARDDAGTFGAVSTLQSLLNLHGAKLVVDGSFGPLTAAAVEAYQREHGLTPDRSVGPASWSELIWKA